VADTAPLACLTVALLALASFLTLFVLRAQDDNRLSSWQWLFADGDLFRMVLFLIVGLFIAFVLVKNPFPVRRPAPLLFVSSFVAGAMMWGEPEVIVDASRYFTQAKHVALYGPAHFFQEWGGQIAAWTDLPLLPLLYGLIFSLTGEERISIQIFTTLLFSGTVVLTYRIGRMLWDETVGFTAALLLLGMPYLLSQVPLMLVDVPTMFFVTLAVFATLQALRYGGAGRLLLAAAAVALAFWTKYSAWLLLSVLPVVWLVELKDSPRAALRRAAILAAGCAIPIGAALFMMHDVVAGQIDLLQDYQAPGLRRWGESLASTFLFQIHPFVTVAALCSLYVAVKRRDVRYAIVLWLPLLMLLLEVKRIRYLLPVFPMLALMAAYALREIRVAEVRKYAVLGIVASSVVLAVFGFLPFLQKTSAMNLKQAGAYLDSLAVDSVQVIALPQVRAPVNPAVSVPLLDLFTAARLFYHPEEVSAPVGEGVNESSLRFTWEHKNPEYYRAGPPARAAGAVVVIAGDNAQSWPDSVGQRLRDYSLSREFVVSEDIFGYRTIVKVYLPASRTQRG
jgi:4-amino-4-deoxy-L-arabinose transferase-like glycosyltransferase